MAAPIISGTASDDIGIDTIWLTIKDDIANRYWDGTKWAAGNTLLYVPGVFGKKLTAWEYNSLTKDVLRSGTYTIKAYVKDRVGRKADSDTSSAYRKRLYLGKKDFTAFGINVKTVKNDGLGTIENSFTTLPPENSIFIEAEILPVRVGPYLNDKVKWTIDGVNSASGNPSAWWGNPSAFLVANPEVPAYPQGRGVAMEYGVYARVEQETGSVGSARKDIHQDELDQLRQEYVDLSKIANPERSAFVNETTYVNPGAFPFTNSDSRINFGRYNWAMFTIAQNLQEIQYEYPRIMETSSGYRNPIYNDSLKNSAKDSPHIYGEAADIDINTNAEWLQLCNLAVAAGACVEPHSIAPGWVHMGWLTISPQCKNTWPHGDVPCKL